MKKTKLLVSSLGIILLSSSLIAGATYSLFTSTSNHDITVSSANVDLAANIVQGSLKYYSIGSPEAVPSLPNGGSASIDPEGNLVLTNITPGDKLTFDIKFTNLSDVKIKYRVAVNCKTGSDLFSALTITGHGDGNWIELGPKLTPDNLTMSIEFPQLSGNFYQDKTTVITFKVEAVQGNADVSLIKETDESLKMKDQITASKMSALLSEGETPVTPHDAITKLNQGGYVFEDLVPAYTDHVFAYNSETNTTLPLIESELLNREADPNIWLIVQNEDDLIKYTPKYSIYLGTRFVENEPADKLVTVNNGFDIGTHKDINVNYVDTVAETVKLVTNNSKITVNNPNGTVEHYADALDVDVQSVASHSYHEFGTVKGTMKLDTGRVVIEDKGEISTLNVLKPEAKVAVNNTQSKVKIVAKTGVNLDTVLDSKPLPETATKVPYKENFNLYVSTLNGKQLYFNSMAQALGAIDENSGGKIVLLNNISFNDNYIGIQNKDVEIDLNGFCLTANNSTFGLMPISEVKLIVKNGFVKTNDGFAMSHPSGYNCIIGFENVQLDTIESADGGNVLRIGNGEYYSDKNTVFNLHHNFYGIFFENEPRLDIHGKYNIDATGHDDSAASCISGNGSTDYNKIAVVNIYDDATLIAKNTMPIYLPNTCEVNIMGGFIEGSTGIAIKCGTLNITGGTIHANGSARNGFATNNNGCSDIGNAIILDASPTVYKGANPIINIADNITDKNIYSDNSDPIALYIRKIKPDTTKPFKYLSKNINPKVYQVIVDSSEKNILPKEDGSGELDITDVTQDWLDSQKPVA